VIDGVDPPLAGWLPLEMLDGVRHVDPTAIDSCFLEGRIEEPTCAPDEWTTSSVLAIAWLLSHEDDLRVDAAGPEDRLGATSPESAGAAAARRERQVRRRRLALPRHLAPGGRVGAGETRAAPSGPHAVHDEVHEQAPCPAIRHPPRERLWLARQLQFESRIYPSGRGRWSMRCSVTRHCDPGAGSA